MNICIVYGSTTGTTESVANVIAEKLGVADVYDVNSMDADVIAAHDVLVLGTSTWGDGELQDDWYEGVNVLKGADLSGKKVALFGCGDSESYCDTFCDGMSALYEALQGTGCTFVGGGVDAADYSFSSSKSVVDGKFVGLAIDDMNESDKTEDRVSAWVEALEAELA